MSFIFGTINLDGKTSDQLEIGSLAQAVKWEGFKEQTITEGNYSVGLCHHPEREPKAAIFRNDQITLVADIRIYNAEELQKSFTFNTPAEAFSKAYLLWGTSCANHINGDFAVVVIDRRTNEVHLFRDHIGARPLTYCFRGNRLIFASHEFGLAKSGLIKTSLSQEKFITHFFRFKGKYSQTVFRHIYKVTPGYCISFSVEGHKSTKYWKPEDIRKDNSLMFDDVVVRLRQLIVNATLKRVEPGKTGVHVSGGIDSCGVASILASHTDDKSQLYGYSWSPEEFEDEYEGVNEKEFIDAFSRENKISVKYQKLKENDVVKDAIIPEFEVQHIEHPVMKMAEEDGIKTLFSGWGGDEFVSLSLRGTLNHLFFSCKWFSLAQFIKQFGVKSVIKRSLTEIIPLLVPFGLMHSYKSEYTNWSKLCLLKPSFIIKNCKSIFFHKRKNVFGYGNRKRFALNLLENRHLPERMESWAVNAEFYGYEYKYPLLDKDLLEFWFSIPVEYTFKDFHSRILFREAMKGILMEEIRTRKDKGEGMRMTYSRLNRKKGEKYVRELFMAIPEKEHLSFIRPDALLKVIDKNLKTDDFLNAIKQNQAIIYLRYYRLVKRYLSEGTMMRHDLSDTYLRNFSKLSLKKNY